MWSIGRIMLTGKNQNTRRKTWPSATLSTTNPIRTGLHMNLGVCGERSRTVRAIYFQWEKWPKNAFYCIDQSWCVTLHVACVTNTGCVLFERLHNSNCHTAVVWSWLHMPNITYPIFGQFSLISSIHHCWLRNSLSKLPKTAFSDGS